MWRIDNTSTIRSRKPWEKGIIFALVLLVSILTASVGLYIFNRSLKVEPTLRFVSIVHRHGDRAPEITYPLDPYNSETFWPDGLGELLKRGKVRMYNFGMFLRHRYEGFLSSKYSPDEIFVLSSDANRCIMSVELVLAGLYPPTGEQIWNPDLLWQPIPVHPLPASCDDMLTASKPCPLLYQERMQRNAIIQQKLDENQNFLADLSNSTGLQVTTIDQLYYLGDYVSVVEEERLPLPDWALNSAIREKLNSMANIANMRHFYTPLMIKLYSGVLIHDIISNMERKSNPGENFVRRLSLYSAHSGTVQTLWGGLNISQDMPIPSYGAAIILELHEIDGKLRVKILYKKSNLDENLTVLKIRGCKDAKLSENDEMCDLDVFSSALQTTAIDDFDKACKIPEDGLPILVSRTENQSSKMIAKMVVFLAMLAVVVAHSEPLQRIFSGFLVTAIFGGISSEVNATFVELKEEF